MKYKSIILQLSMLCSIEFSMHAELLVVKKMSQGLIPLPDKDADEQGQKIAETLEKFQWPPVIATKLTEQQKQELFAPDKPRAEEIFIEKNLQQEIGSENFDPAVIFIPTTLYELFCIGQFFKDKDTDGTLYHVGRRYLFDYEKSKYPDVRNPLDITEILNRDEDLTVINQRVHEVYHEVNMHFLQKNKNATLYVNQECIKMLFNLYPELKNCTDSLQASNVIQEHSQELTQKLIKDLSDVKDKMRIFPPVLCLNEGMQKITDGLSEEKNAAMINQYISLEYKARQHNKALVSRGTTPIELDYFYCEHEIPEILLIGSTILIYQIKRVVDYQKCSLSQAYQENTIRPYSISFGSSLLAGFFKDRTACVFNFLQGVRMYDESESQDAVAGYALMIDKQKYIDNQNSNLFFIPSLNTLASLMSCGEYFHPRTKAAKAAKSPESIISGLSVHEIKDPSGVILVQRDPLEHAALFSDFVAENCTIIQRFTDEDVTQEDTARAQQILENQKLAAVMYRKMQQEASIFDTAK